MNKIALIYDFDKTLSPRDMQEFHLIPSLGYDDPKEFWDKCKNETDKYNMDSILSYMLMIKKDNPDLTYDDLKKEGKYLELFKGVDTWFERINRYGKRRGIEVEHYIISSGLKEMIEGSKIAKYFKRIYACSYAFDDNGKILWPARVVNYTTKTQYLFRINKNVLDETNDRDLNRSTPEEEKYIPFNNMVYFGDGLTDVPSMKVVRGNGGYTIAVYNSALNKQALAMELKNDKRANFALEANYSKGSDIEKVVKMIIDTAASMHRMEEL